MAVWIKADGTRTSVTPKEGNEFSLDELQKFVDGYIEIMFVPERDRAIVINEEGLLRSLPENFIASRMCKQTIVGDVLLCSRNQIS